MTIEITAEDFGLPEWEMTATITWHTNYDSNSVGIIENIELYAEQIQPIYELQYDYDTMITGSTSGSLTVESIYYYDNTGAIYDSTSYTYPDNS